MLIFPCQVCNTQLSAEESQAGQLVRCPTCLTTLRVPAADDARGNLHVGAKPAASALYLIDGSGFIFRAFHALPPMTGGGNAR